MSKHLDSQAIVAELERRIQTLAEAFAPQERTPDTDWGPEQLEALEQRWHAQARELADLITRRARGATRAGQRVAPAGSQKA